MVFTVRKRKQQMGETNSVSISFLNKLRFLLRPAKKEFIKFLVMAKRFVLLLFFRLTRFLKVLRFFTSRSERKQYSTSFSFRLQFNNHLRLGFSKFHFFAYSLLFSQQISIGIIGPPGAVASAWAKKMTSVLNAKIFWVDAKESPIKNLRMKILSEKYSRDLLLVDLNFELPNVTQVLQLLMARNRLRPEFRVSAVHPGYTDSEAQLINFNGFSYNSSLEQWDYNYSPTNQYSQNNVPTWSLRPHWHCLLMSSDSLEQLNIALSDNSFPEHEIETISQALWAQNKPILCYPNFRIGINNSTYRPRINPQNESWNKPDKSCQKVIFVLPATTLSGGIRVVFEIAEGLNERGVEVEIWSLRSPVSWELGKVVLKQFHTYISMIQALSIEEAIKVATWWETADIVFLSSVSRGIPVQFVQEFETWFYPHDNGGQAAVVSSYRPEFRYITTASFQLNELQSIGIKPTLIPVGYDSKTYFEIENSVRQPGVILAVGRSFFQKNFAMTARAWKRITNPRIYLWLFGHEPKVLSGRNVTYFNKPSNSEVNVLLNKAEIFIQTSLHEGFSLPVLEAMAAGCPVITTDSHGNRDFCFNEENCLIVEQNNDEQLEELITKLLGDHKLRQNLSMQGIKTAQKYQWSRILDQYRSYFSEFLKDSK
jgi:glycosyltransferase involved in cell wall biosynthesis